MIEAGRKHAPTGRKTRPFRPRVSVGVSTVDCEKNLAGLLLESWAKHVNL